MKILIVEDDPGLSKLLQKATMEAGYNASVESDGLMAWSRIPNEAFDLILLDVMLPGMDGFTFCQKARAAGVATPILIVTAKDAVKDKIEGLDAGADDYIVKPFLIAELLARVRALLRRGSVLLSPVLQVGDLILNPATREARRGERNLHFSATEYALLEYLMRNAGRVLTRSLILEHVWQYDFGGNDNVLDVYISYLRGKIDKGFPRTLIHTVRSVGFLMADRTAEK